MNQDLQLKQSMYSFINMTSLADTLLIKNTVSFNISSSWYFSGYDLLNDLATIFPAIFVESCLFPSGELRGSLSCSFFFNCIYESKSSERENRMSKVVWNYTLGQNGNPFFYNVFVCLSRAGNTLKYPIVKCIGMIPWTLPQSEKHVEIASPLINRPISLLAEKEMNSSYALLTEKTNLWM